MLPHVLQDCQTKIEQLDAEKDKLYFQLATEVSSKKAVSICIHCTVAVRHVNGKQARQSSNGSSQHELSSYPSPYASNGGNGYHAADQSETQAPPGFSQVSPALQQRLGRQQVCMQKTL